VSREGRPALAGLRVLDLSTIFAGPVAAMLLADSGADVIKIEHPRGDPLRAHGHSKNGHGLMWKQINRNKRCVTLDLSRLRGQEVLLAMARQADVLIENFRPGVMERWNLGYERLAALNQGLVMLRMTGFGQFGPYAQRPGFGTLAESMSGFAAITGEAGAPPTLPPFGLADSVAGMAGAYAIMTAIHARAADGRGQMIDIAIIEPIMAVLGNQALVYDQLGVKQERLGNRSMNNAPRNTYRTRDGHWVAVSTSADRIAARLMELVGHPEVTTADWFATGFGRAQHADLLDELVGGWIGQRDQPDVLRLFEEAGAAVSPVYEIDQAMSDPQYGALGTFVEIEDEDLGPLRMQNVLFRMSANPASVRFAGRRLGQDNDEVFPEFGFDPEELRALSVI
jgi:crotonobetainyl-CoA:carnitine CoA-transferase CaiB-like acyl-CoA transferase